MHLHPASVVEPGGTGKSPVSVRDRLNQTRGGKLWWKICLHPHLVQGGTPPEAMAVDAAFFSLTDRSYQFQNHSLKRHFFKNWDKFDSQNLKRHARSSSVILNGHSSLWRMGNAGLLKDLNYNTV